jgi:hypothetical protein
MSGSRDQPVAGLCVVIAVGLMSACSAVQWLEGARPRLWWPAGLSWDARRA